ncbi:haloacid dehalogenase [Ceratobasidium sp. AG-Ba]|nr:haloacid dehalogenase [Ceratobasidium sp. AG-Ba]
MAVNQKIKIVFFDALFTIVKPRRPIIEQYHRVFIRHHIAGIDESKLGGSFKKALRELQTERPAYRSAGKMGKGEDAGEDGEQVRNWWGEVVRRTAVGAGADNNQMNERLDDAVTDLLHIFSSKEGYKLVDGAFQTLSALNGELGVKTGLVSNADLRILKALDDLGATSLFDPTIISEREGIEKPDRRMWEIACRRAGVEPGEAAHVGDEYDADVVGALNAGLKSIWYRPVGEPLHRDEDAGKQVPRGAELAEHMLDVVEIVKRWNDA